MNPNTIAPAILVGSVVTAVYALRMRQIKKPSGQPLAPDEQRVCEILCESSVRLRGFLAFSNASHTKLILTDRRLLLCSRDERQVRLALRPEDVVEVQRLQVGLFGKVPGFLVDYLENGRERRVRFQTPVKVDVLVPMSVISLSLLGSTANMTTCEAFLDHLTMWRERHRSRPVAQATA